MDIDFNEWAYRLNSKNKYRFGLKYQKITGEQLKAMIEYFNYKCAYTGEELTKDNLTIDHIYPRNDKGVHAIYNIVPCDKKVNNQKGKSHASSWFLRNNKDKEEKIYEWIAIAYTKWGKQ